MNAGSIDRKINGYLSSLNLEQKKAVLTVVKTFAASKQDDSVYSEEFKKELDQRYEDIMAGKNMVSEEEVNKRIETIIKGRKKK